MTRGEAPILLVSASAGTGHISAGNALQAALNATGTARAEHVDVLDLAPRWVRRAYGGGFELLALRAPRIWREVYELSDGPGGDAARWGPLAHRLLFRGFRRLLGAAPWSQVACTHFLPGQLAAGRAGHPPFSMVVTDFSLHRYWVQPRILRYFVASDVMAAELRTRLPHVGVHATGIPVSPHIRAAAANAASSAAVQHARDRFGLARHRRSALVMGGGLGLGVEDAVRGALGTTGDDVQIVAVCGRNNAARARLESLGLAPDRLRVFGFIDGVAELMAAVDVVVTKPGGLTCSEALALGRPLVLTRGMPGHEEANVRFLTGAGAAVYASEPIGVGAAVRAALAEPTASRLRAAAGRIGRADAAARIAAALLHSRRAGVAA